LRLREFLRWFSARFRESFQNPGSVTIFVATCKHLMEAAVLAFTPSGDGSVGIAGMLLIIPNCAFISREHLLSVIMLGSVWLSLCSVHSKTIHHKVGAIMLVPQQTLLLAACGSALWATAYGRYVDGYSPPVDYPSLFVLCDQCVRILLAPAYTIALIARLSWYGGGRFGVSGG
jgi:hypothetical protein